MVDFVIDGVRLDEVSETDVAFSVDLHETDEGYRRRIAEEVSPD